MIRIIEKEVKVIKMLEVEPTITTLYLVNREKEDIVEIPNATFFDINEIGGDYYIRYTTPDDNIYGISIVIETKEVKDCNINFFDYEQAKKQHRLRRLNYCKERLTSYQNTLKHAQTKINYFKNSIEKIEKEK